MTISISPAQMGVTNAELHEMMWDGKSVSQLSFKEPIRIGHAQVRSPLDLQGCEFLEGFTFQNIRLAHDVIIDGSRLVGDCNFEQVFTSRILSLLDIETVGATFRFDGLSISPAETADFMVSFKNKDSIPKLVTDNKIVRAMFDRLQEKPTSIVSYQETKEEME